MQNKHFQQSLAFNLAPDLNVVGAAHFNYLRAPAVRRRRESKLKIIYGSGRNVQVRRCKKNSS